MAVRTRRLAGPVLLTTTTDTLLYTCPGDRTALVKTISLANSTGSSVACQIGIGGTGNGKDIFRTSGVNANSGVFNSQSEMVIMPGESVYAKAGTANALTVSLHGAQLLGAPA